MNCYCDYDTPSVYQKTTPVARLHHKCSECGREIVPGHQYESVFGVWNGMAGMFKTCARCVAMREWVEAHVPCLCWEHGNMLEVVAEAAREYAHEAPGLLFGALRRYLKPRQRIVDQGALS